MQQMSWCSHRPARERQIPHTGLCFGRKAARDLPKGAHDVCLRRTWQTGLSSWSSSRHSSPLQLHKTPLNRHAATLPKLMSRNVMYVDVPFELTARINRNECVLFACKLYILDFSFGELEWPCSCVMLVAAFKNVHWDLLHHTSEVHSVVS